MSNLQLKTLTEKYFDKYKNWKPNFKFNQGFNIEDPLVKPETKIETGTGIATSTGVGTATEVPATNESSQDWHNHMASLGYKKKVLKDGSHLYVDPNTGINYFNNGRAYNPTTKNRWGYQWQDLKNQNFSYTGQNEYSNIFNLQNDFDNQFNQYIGNPYTLSGNDTQKNRDLLRKDPRYNKAYQNFLNQYKYNPWFGNYSRKKHGGIINKHQQGGKMNENIQQQIVQLVQAAMQGSKEATQQINQIMAAAKQGDQKATQLAQMIQAVAQQIQGGSVKAALGAKLNYVQKLKGNCPEGTEKIYLKNGGCMCQQKKQSGGALPNKNSAPDKLKKKLKPQTPLKPVKPVDTINKIACGGKTKKKK